MGEGCFICSLHLSTRVLDVSPMYSSSQAMLLHWETVYNSTFVVPGVLVLRLHEVLFYGSIALEMYLDTMLTTDVFETFGYSFSVWYYYLTYCGLVSWKRVVVVLCLGCCLSCIVLWLSASVDMEIPSLLVVVLCCSGRILLL